MRDPEWDWVDILTPGRYVMWDQQGNQVDLGRVSGRIIIPEGSNLEKIVDEHRGRVRDFMRDRK